MHQKTDTQKKWMHWTYCTIGYKYRFTVCDNESLSLTLSKWC